MSIPRNNCTYFLAAGFLVGAEVGGPTVRALLFLAFVKHPGPGRSLRLFWSTAKEQGNGRFSVGSMERCLASMEVQGKWFPGGRCGIPCTVNGRPFCSSAASKYRRRACECLRTAGRNGSSRNRPLLLGSRDFERFAFNLLCFFCFLFHADEVDGQQRRLCRKIKKSSEAFLTLGAGCRSRGQGVSLVGGEKGSGGVKPARARRRASGAVREPRLLSRRAAEQQAGTRQKGVARRTGGCGMEV